MSETPNISDQVTEKEHIRLGHLLVKEGLITPEQLQEALQSQQQAQTPQTHYHLGQLLLNKGLISTDQLRRVLRKYDKQSRLGEILLHNRLLSKAELDEALKLQENSGERLGEILLKKNLLGDADLRHALCTQLNIPFIDLSRISLDPNLSKIINRAYATRHQIVPVAATRTSLTLAMDDPTNNEVISELEMFTQLKINVVTSSRSAIREAFNRLYSRDPKTKKRPASALDHKLEQLDFSLAIEDDDPHTVRKPKYVEVHESQRADILVQHILSWAIKHQASDIHFETLDQRMAVRFRVDGLLQEFDLGALQDDINAFHREIVSRIKILGKLDIAERRLPQDGSFRSHVTRNGQRTNLDFRISVIPCFYGENVVIRILDSGQALKNIDQMGFSPRLSQRLGELFQRNTGILLVTGPTGSGKSTTLHSGLLTAYRPGLKVLTAEDPIEYIHENFMQCEVNEKIGLTFASYIRVFLRHDPEIIMVGEIRDEETADMAIRAAQTGHLVLSTLHTNDTISAISRLTGLGIEPSLITSSLIGVVSQRLARRICPNCRESYQPKTSLLNEFFATPPGDIDWIRGRGCRQCNYTGYKGRLPLAELWEPSPNDILLINKQAPLEQLRQSAQATSISIMEEARLKLQNGETTMDELIRVLPYFFIAEFRNRQSA